MDYGFSTLGVKLGWATGSSDTLPSAFTLLTRIKDIPGVEPTPEQLDVSTIEDFSVRRVPGRSDPGDSYDILVNRTKETIAEWTSVISASNSAGGVWLEIYDPNTPEYADFLYVKTPDKLPTAPVGDNAVRQMTIHNTILNWYGSAAGVEPVASA